MSAKKEAEPGISLAGARIARERRQDHRVLQPPKRDHPRAAESASGLAPPSPSGIRGILWVVQSIDLWLVSRGHLMTPMKYSDRHLAGLSARPPDRVELIGAGSLGYGTGPSFG